jgi:hypothetical protein
MAAVAEIRQQINKRETSQMENESIGTDGWEEYA